MTRGPILKQLLLFAVPLLFGNIFQMLYNTVDSIVVGNFVGKEALAAVGSTTMIINMLVFFFNGFSVGAGVGSGTVEGGSGVAVGRGVEPGAGAGVGGFTSASKENSSSPVRPSALTTYRPVISSIHKTSSREKDFRMVSS